MNDNTTALSYARLFWIELKHSYYANGLCRDLDVVPSADTARLLRNHRCVVKPKANGAEIYVETDKFGKPKIAFDGETTLSFGLCLNNPEFLLFTDSTPLRGKNGWGITYAKEVVIANPKVRAAPFFAKLDISRDFNRVDGERIEIEFSAKPVYWIYYLITDLKAGVTFSVAGQESSGIIWEYKEETDPISVKLKMQYPDMAVLRFVSQKPAPCRESGLQAIQLLLEKNGTTTVIIGNLPNPSWRNYFQLNTAANQKSADAIYHVVTYLTTIY